MKLSLKTAPSTEPISAAEFKVHQHLDADQTAEDTMIASIIKAARETVETCTQRALITQTWYAYLDGFPSEDFIELPLGNLGSVTSITTKDYEGTETVLTATTQYLVDDTCEPGRIVLPYSVSWPSLNPYAYNPITIEFVCGYGGASDVPDSLKAAIKLIAGDFYENGSSQVLTNFEMIENRTARNLMMMFRLWDFY